MQTAAASIDTRAAGLTSIAVQLQAAYDAGEAKGRDMGRAEGWTACAALHGLPLGAPPAILRPRHLTVVPAVTAPPGAA